MANYDNALSKLETIVCRWLFKRIVVQGHRHRDKMCAVLGEFREAARKEFYEDSDASLDSYLKECFDESRETA